MFASWFGLTAFRTMNGATKKSRRRKGRTTLDLEVLEDRWVPSTTTVMDPGGVQPLYSVSPNAGQPGSVTVNWTPSGSTLPDATQYKSYSVVISAAASSGSSTLSVGIDPNSQSLLKSMGLTAVVTPGGEGTPGTVTIQGIPTSVGNDLPVTVFAYREPTEPLGSNTYTLNILKSPVEVTSSKIDVTPLANPVPAGQSVDVTAKVTDLSNNAINQGTVTFTLTGASGTILTSSPVTPDTNGDATAALNIPSTEPSGSFNLTVNYSGVSGLIAPASATYNGF